MSHYLDELNEPQRGAVEQIDGPVMIIAGAGSGKTRVLTYRIAHMIRNGIDPFNILSLTFTNKAAKEMKERIEKVVGGEARNIWMGTFHSIFARVLRTEADKIGYPTNFVIYDTEDSQSLIKTILKEQNLDDKIYKPNMVLNRISSAKNNLLSVSAYQQDLQIQADDAASGRPKIGLLYELYSKRCFKAGAMDFDDLIFKMYVLLRNFPDLLHKYQHRFKYIMVDEFQDTNFAQYAVLKKLAAAFQNLCVVGDDAQSIYAFRGADIQNILSFEKDFSDLKVFKLEQNYRSTQMIVHAANSIIDKNKAQIKKNVWTDNAYGDKIKVLRSMSDNEEGLQIAQSVFENKMNHQLKNKDFAILYRTNAQSRTMEAGLRKMNVPYRIHGGLSFYKRSEIKDLLAYCRLAFNTRDEEALKRIINKPTRGIGKTTEDALLILADSLDITIWEVLERIHEFPSQIRAGARTAIQDFVTLIRSFAVVAKNKDAYEAATHIATASTLLRDLHQDKTPEGVSKFENVQELLNGIKEFVDATLEKNETAQSEEEMINPTLEVFMQDIALLTDADKDDGNDDKVTLMTIHASKGLEFKHVYVVGLEENLFPSMLSVNSRSELEEERRLFYVAVTRAETKLTLSYATSRYKNGGLIPCDPSRFISEINQDYLDISQAVPGRVDIGSRANAFGDDWIDYDSPRVAYKPKADYGARPKPAPKPSYTPPPAGKGNFKPVASASAAPIKAIDDFVGDPTDQLKAGDRVVHPRFGNGQVLQIEGSGQDRKATIQFQGQGNKQLLLKFAKLKVLSSN